MSITPTLENQPAAIPTKISENERCDNCGAKALWLVYFTKSELAFCNHHYVRFSANPAFADKYAVQITD